MNDTLTNKELIKAYKIICDELRQAKNEEIIEVLNDMEEMTRSILHYKIYSTLKDYGNELKPGYKVLEEI